MTTSHVKCERVNNTESMAMDPNMADLFPAIGPTVKTRSFKKRRRRNRSNFFYLLESAGKISEESDTTDEALRDYMENIAAQQSDSDLEVNMARRLSSLRFQLNNLNNDILGDRADSDCSTEVNYQKKRRKRKRKQKKQCLSGSSTSPTVTLQPSIFKLPSSIVPPSKPRSCDTGKHVVLKAHRSKINDDDFLADAENGHTSSCGEYGNPGTRPVSLERVPHKWSHKQHELSMELCQNEMDSDDNYMSMSDHNTPESSALSSSSDDDLFTNDEGQFGDDEHEESCYETESQSRWFVKSLSDEEDQKFHELYKETLEYLRSKPFFLEDEQVVNNRQSGSSFLRPEMGGTSTMLEVNKRIKKFLQDPTKMELRLAHVKRKDKDELCQLAALYSLNCKMEDSPRKSMVVLVKTRNTSKPEQSALCHFLGRPFREMQESQTCGPSINVKRRRKTSPQMSGFVGDGAPPLPDSNVGNQILQNMGWTPGQGLGPSSSGICEPVKAFKRSGRQGLGHGYRNHRDSKS